MDWQPIATAPKDGDVLVYGPAGYCVAYQFHGTWQESVQGGESIHPAPTHWAKLEPPSVHPVDALVEYARGMDLFFSDAVVADLRAICDAVCDECGRSSFACTNCGTETAIDETTDVFHVGTCPKCGDRDAQPCQARVSPTSASLPSP